MECVDVSIVIINYKNYKMTMDAINSIIDNSHGFSYEIIIVDNSNDINEFEELSKCSRENIKIINANANLGFGKANNLGVANSSGEKILFLNNDTKLINNAIFELLSTFKENVGIVGANLYTKNMLPTFSYENNEKNIKNDKKNLSLSSLILKKIFKKNLNFNKTSKVLRIEGFVSGACLMIDRKAFLAIGGFDKDIFMYSEDVLLCYRVKNELKLSILNNPKAKVIHFEFGGDNVLSPFKIKCTIDGNIIYYEKTFGKVYALKYLKTMAHCYNKLVIYSTIIMNKNKLKKYKLFLNEYKKSYVEYKKNNVRKL